jgi:hypothetical protein
MSKYLARLDAIIQKKSPRDEVPKETFGTFGTDPGRHVSPVNMQPGAAINSQNIPTPLSAKSAKSAPGDAPPNPDPVEINERGGMATDKVPDSYLDAWARFQSQCPAVVIEERWRQAVADAGRFLNQWGKLADSFGWSSGDLFDVPRDGAMGLAWWLKGRTVSALGPEHACVGQPVYDRVMHTDWVNPYTRPVRPVSLSPILEHQQKIMRRVLGR